MTKEELGDQAVSVHADTCIFQERSIVVTRITVLMADLDAYTLIMVNPAPPELNASGDSASGLIPSFAYLHSLVVTFQGTLCCGLVFELCHFLLCRCLRGLIISQGHFSFI